LIGVCATGVRKKRRRWTVFGSNDRQAWRRRAVSTVSWPAAANSDMDERDEVNPYGNESWQISALENVIETATIT